MRVRKMHNYDKWNLMYNLAKNYYEHYGNLNISQNFKTLNGYDYNESGYGLGKWLVNQKISYKNRYIPKEERKNVRRALSDEQVQKLKEIDIVFEVNLTWEKWYDLAKNYYEYYGNLNIPYNFKTKNGYEYDENGYGLGVWLKIQRASYKNRNIPKEKIKDNSLKSLTDEQVQKLKNIGMVFKLPKITWDEWYNLAELYYKYYGNLNIPKVFKTKNGYEYDENGYKLGNWIINQRKAYKIRNIPQEKIKNNNLKLLTDDQIQKLENIGIVFALPRITWNEWYNLAKSYYKYYGNLNVPYNFKTKNGYEYDENGYSLGIWISNQRTSYKNRYILKEEGTNYHKPLSDEKVRKLKEIGMIFNIFLAQWETMYNLAKEYYKRNGNLNVPYNFKTKNGYEYDENGYNLSSWLERQRVSFKIRNNSKPGEKNKYSLLSDEQIQKLEQIEIIFEINLTWDDAYNLAKEYYKHYGNLSVPYHFRTSNGYDYNENGYGLGRWLANQRIAYKNRNIPKEERANARRPLSDEQVRKLESIGMIFEIRKNLQEINVLLENFGINEKKYSFLKRIPIKELKAKINYLIENNQPLIVGDKLHEIFYISNIDLKAKYGIDIKELINNYLVEARTREIGD